MKMEFPIVIRTRLQSRNANGLVFLDLILTGIKSSERKAIEWEWGSQIHHS